MTRITHLLSIRVVASLCLFSLALGCRSAPVTGRKQLLIVPEDQEVALGLSSYQDVTSKETASTNAQYLEMVNRVGQRIAAVSGRTDYKWEFRVLASTEQNAFCLPGGKVAVYEGIIPVCQNEAGLAVVMSHEIGHALARHGGERMSQNYVVDGSKQLLSYATQSQEQTRRDTILKAYGAAAQYGVILPYSRKHESEADRIGLMLMAKAGYNPEEAPRFWQRFGASNQGNTTPVWASTHPSDATRAADLQAQLPEAMGLYVQAPTRYDLGELIAAAPTTPAAAPTSQAPAASVAARTTNTPSTSPVATPSTAPTSTAPANGQSTSILSGIGSMIPSVFGSWLPQANAAPVQSASSAGTSAPAKTTVPAPPTTWTPPPFVPPPTQSNGVSGTQGDLFAQPTATNNLNSQFVPPTSAPPTYVPPQSGPAPTAPVQTSPIQSVQVQTTPQNVPAQNTTLQDPPATSP